MNPRKVLLARSWLLSLISTTVVACVGALAAWAQTPSPLPTPTQINFDDPLGSVKFTETMWESVGSRYPLKPRTWLGAAPTIPYGSDYSTFGLSPAVDTSGSSTPTFSRTRT